MNERFCHWLEHVYHRYVHGALGTTPLLRWQRYIAQVRQLPPSTGLRRLFFHRVDRLVRRDSQRIELRFDPLDTAHVELGSSTMASVAVRRAW